MLKSHIGGMCMINGSINDLLLIGRAGKDDLYGFV